MPAATYTLDELDELEELAEKADPNHLKSARSYILKLCQEDAVPVGILGGYSLWLRGSRRRTTDIDLYFRGTMSRVKSLFNAGDRVIRPASALAADVYRIFVRTAGNWDHMGGREQIVQVDIMPQEGLAGGTIEMIRVDDQDIPVITIDSMLENKFRSFYMRESSNDVTDIKWMIRHYPSSGIATRNNIPYKHREQFLEALDERSTSWKGIRNRFKKALKVMWPLI